MQPTVSQKLATSFRSWKMTAAWSAPTTPDEMARRAGGRKRYNTWRKSMAFYRRCEISRLLTAQGAFRRGYQTKLARQLGVSRATVCRDVAALRREGRPCTACGAWHTPPRRRTREDHPSTPNTLPLVFYTTAPPDAVDHLAAAAEIVRITESN
jgi:HTH domain